MRIVLTLLTVFLALAEMAGSSEVWAAEPAQTTSAENTGNDALQALARAFFEWRRVQQPVQGDDIPRVERPEGWVPDYSPVAVKHQEA